MTSILNRDVAFGAITGMGGPNANPLVALAGPRHTILRAAKSGGQMQYLGESADLGGEPLAVENSSSPNFHVLTTKGMVRVSNVSAPQVVSTTLFDPGGGRWLALFGSFLATPLANGGVQILNATTGAQISVLTGMISDSRYAVAHTAQGVLYVVDGKTANIAVIKVNTTTGAMTYVGKVRAPNCRDIIKVTADLFNATTGQLFVVCRRRIVRFTFPIAAVANPDLLLPTFARDYGVASVDYTDLVVMSDNKYWIAQDYVTSPTPLDNFYGPTFGVWDSTIGSGEMFVAAPEGSIWTVNNATPYYTVTTVPVTPPPPVVVVPPTPPPVVAPAAPVITSSLIASTTEDTVWSYTITATGTGPITYSVSSPPAWLTSINALTGAISGTPPDPATVNLTIRATNAGGTTSATLVLTVTAAIGNNTGVYTNGAINSLAVVGNLVYCGGQFTSVTDASGSLTRNNLACLNLTTGRWTTWNPNCNNAVQKIVAHSDGDIYVNYPVSTGSIGGVVRQYIARIDTSGALVTGFNHTFNTTVTDICSSGSFLYAVGSFATVSATARASGCAFTGNSLNSWQPQNALGQFGAGWQRCTPFGSQIFLAGNSAGQFIDTGNTGLGTLANSIGVASAATGVFSQATRRYQGATCTSASRDASCSIGGTLYFGANNQGILWVPAPLAASGAPPTIATDLPAFSTTLALSTPPAPTMVGTNFTVGTDGSSLFLGGDQLTSFNGDSARKYLVKLDTSGTLISGFTFASRGNASFASSNPSIYVTKPALGAIVVVGNFSGASNTYDGTRAENILILNATTGARL
jgi:hypothetical protein